MIPVASPFSTGGGGEDFQTNVTVHYLAALLAQGFGRGVGPHIVREVRLQQLYTGALVDDLIVSAGSNEDTRTLHIQIKHQFTIGETESFDELLKKLWSDFNHHEFRQNNNRLAIGYGVASPKIDKHFRQCLLWAKESPSWADFNAKIENAGSREKREFITMVERKIRSYLEEISQPFDDADALKFLQVTSFIHFDYGDDAARDYANSIETLRYLVPPDQEQAASNLFAQLYRYAGGRHPTAAVFDYQKLTQMLLQDRVTFGPTYAGRCNAAVLEKRNEEALLAIRDTVGGFSLPREQLLNESLKLIEESNFVELVGPPGCGKSALLKALANNLPPTHIPVVLAWDRINASSWNDFARAAGILGSPTEFALMLFSRGLPCVFIDGLDRIESKPHQNVVNDLLTALHRALPNSGGTQPWKIVVTRRIDSSPESFDWLNELSLAARVSQPVPQVDDDEFHFLTDRIPQFNDLPVDPPQPLLRNLKFLALLADPQIFSGLRLGSSIVTEIELCNLWWERIVSRVGTEGAGRKRALLALGETFVKENRSWFSNNDVDNSALPSLVIDGILRHDPRTDRYKFDHDIIEEWVIFRALKEKGERLISALRESPNPAGLIRPVQLLSQFLLESGDRLTWAKALKATENPGLPGRWKQALLSAPLHSARGLELLETCGEILIENDGAHLRDLLTIVRTVEVDRGDVFAPVLGKWEHGDNIVSSLTDRCTIRRSVWLPLIGWIIEHSALIPDLVKEDVIYVLEQWQRKTPANFQYRKEVGELALAWMTTQIHPNC